MFVCNVVVSCWCCVVVVVVVDFCRAGFVYELVVLMLKHFGIGVVSCFLSRKTFLA